MRKGLKYGFHIWRRGGLSSFMEKNECGYAIASPDNPERYVTPMNFLKYVAYK